MVCEILTSGFLKIGVADWWIGFRSSRQVVGRGGVWTAEELDSNSCSFRFSSKGDESGGEGGSNSGRYDCDGVDWAISNSTRREIPR